MVVTTETFVDALLSGSRVELPDELDAVIAWRFEQLERAGYPELPALAIAVDRSVDLHAACALAARGCPPALALEILL